VTRGYGDFWQGASIDRAKLAQYLPSLLDTADELKAVAGKLGAAAGDLHLSSDASETVVKRTALADYQVVYFATHGLVAGDDRPLVGAAAIDGWRVRSLIAHRGAKPPRARSGRWSLPLWPSRALFSRSASSKKPRRAWARHNAGVGGRSPTGVTPAAASTPERASFGGNGDW
jgi:hypothetical protein